MAVLIFVDLERGRSGLASCSQPLHTPRTHHSAACCRCPLNIRARILADILLQNSMPFLHSVWNPFRKNGVIKIKVLVIISMKNIILVTSLNISFLLSNKTFLYVRFCTSYQDQLMLYYQFPASIAQETGDIHTMLVIMNHK